MSSRWTPADRARVLALWRAGGDSQAEIAAATGVPLGTVKYWIRQSGEISQRQAEFRSQVEGARLAAEARRIEVVDRLTELRDKAIAQSMTLVESGEAAKGGSGLRDLVGVWTRATHDIALLTGEVTERTGAEPAELTEEQRAFLAQIEGGEAPAAAAGTATPAANGAGINGHR